MSDETRRAASPGRDTAASRNTTDSSTVPRGNDTGRLIRRHRRHCREVDRAIEDMYGLKPHYPDPAA